MADLNIVIAAQTGSAQSEIARLQAKLRSLDGTVKTNRRGANQLGEAVDANTRGMSRFAKSGLQQTGYQLGDFAVQVGGGTSALQAFGQQGSQLLGIFGATGALLGAAVAIVAALGNAYMKSGAMVKSFSDEIDDLNALVSESHALGRTSAEQFSYLATKYGEVTGSVKGLFLAEKALLELKLTETFIKARKAVAPFARELEKAALIGDGAEERLGNILGGSMAALSGNFDELAESTGMSVTQLQIMAREMPKILAMQDSQESLGAVNNLLDEMGLKGSESFKSLTKEGRENIEMLLKYAQSGQIVNVTLQELNSNIKSATMSTQGLGAVFGLVEEENKRLSQSMADSFGAAFKNIAMGTQTIKGAFRSMALSIIDQLLQVLVVQRLVGAVGTVAMAGGGFTGGTGLAGILSGTSKPPGLAIGGSMQRGKPYLVGERGPELFMANSSGSIVPNNKMGGGSGVTVNQTINISTGVAQTVRTEIAQLMPQIAEASKAAVLDAKQRGGNFSRAF